MSTFVVVEGEAFLRFSPFFEIWDFFWDLGFGFFRFLPPQAVGRGEGQRNPIENLYRRGEIAGSQTSLCNRPTAGFSITVASQRLDVLEGDAVLA